MNPQDFMQMVQGVIEHNDQDQWANFVLYFNMGLYRYALRVVNGNEEMAVDVIQTVFMSLRIRPISVELPEATWWRYLLKRVHNRAIDAIRSENRRKKREEEYQVVHPMTQSETVGKVHITNEENQKLLEAVAELPETQKQAVTLKYLQTLNYDEIAEIMQIPVGTAKTHVRRGIEYLRSIFTAKKPTAE